MRDAGFEPGTTASIVWSAANEQISYVFDNNGFLARRYFQYRSWFKNFCCVPIMYRISDLFRYLLSCRMEAVISGLWPDIGHFRKARLFGASPKV